MQTITTLVSLRKAVDRLRPAGPIALVPTMGALHAGHLSLVRAAAHRAAHVVVSIFVNPRQFGEGEDFAAYPRQMERDLALLAPEGVAIVWAPAPETIYPPGFATSVAVSGVSEGLCGADRPGHFAGVATVVLKLFNQVRPDLALFGEKDWQQLAVIRQMARDLDLVQPAPEMIIALPTVREADGLALSSRNTYLAPAQRQQASALPRAMAAAAAQIGGGAPVAATLDRLRQALLAGGFDRVDYAVVADARTLEPIDRLADQPARLLVAARMGATRLIDNLAIEAC